jgi:hypothetical protein
MAKLRKTWVYDPPKPPKAKVPDSIKAEVSAKAAELINKHLKPNHVKPPPKNAQFNYLIDIFTKWYQSYFYFCTTYACPHPDAISPTFETRFARMQYLENRKFNLAYMRHTGQWNEIYSDLSMDECLSAIRDEPHFIP